MMTQTHLFYCCISISSSHSVLLFSSKEQAVIEMLLTSEKQLRNKRVLYRLCWQFILSADVCHNEKQLATNNLKAFQNS